MQCSHCKMKFHACYELRQPVWRESRDGPLDCVYCRAHLGTVATDTAQY